MFNTWTQLMVIIVLIENGFSHWNWISKTNGTVINKPDLNTFLTKIIEKNFNTTATYSAQKGSDKDIVDDFCFFDRNGSFKVNTSFIFSPNYPNKYPPNISCSGYIQAPSHKKVKFNITELDLEYEEDCLNDFLQLYDGKDRTSPVIAKLCGKNKSLEYYSSSRYLFIEFITDFKFEHYGYRALFEFVEVPQLNETETTSTDLANSLTTTDLADSLTTTDLADSLTTTAQPAIEKETNTSFNSTTEPKDDFYTIVLTIASLIAFVILVVIIYIERIHKNAPGSQPTYRFTNVPYSANRVHEQEHFSQRLGTYV